MLSFVFRIILIVVCGSSVFAKTRHQLFEPELHIPNFHTESGRLYVDERLVFPGDDLVLETGELIQFKRLLGSGLHTVIVLDQDDRAIRLTQFIDPRGMKMFLGYLETNLLLKPYVPSDNLVRLLDFQPRSNYATYVEWLPLETTLTEYLSSNFNTQSRRFKDLIQFFKAFKKISYIGDFTTDQIGYVHERGWVLYDFGVGVRLNYNPENTTELLESRDFKNSIKPAVFKLLESELLKSYQQPESLNSTTSCELFLDSI